MRKESKTMNVDVKNTPGTEDFELKKDLPLQKQSVVYIKTRIADSKSISTGSIITKDGCILTCNHGVENASEIKVRIKLDKDGAQDIRWEDAEIVWKNTKADLAILKIPGEDYPALHIRKNSEEEIKMGEPVYLLGYPFGSMLSDDEDALAVSMFPGNVVSIQKKDGLDYMYLDIEAKKGCGGSPVLSKTDGSIIGVYIGAFTQGNRNLIEEINYARPAMLLWDEILTAEQ